jgi:hypothetical protein
MFQTMASSTSSATSSGVSPKRGIWMVGGTVDSIKGSKLPSSRQVLARFFRLHKTESRQITESAKIITLEVMSFWEKARIPMKKDCHISKKVKDLYGKWQSLRKNCNNPLQSQRQKEDFDSGLDDLFDIAHRDALTLITIPEDREFLIAQREKRRR